MLTKLRQLEHSMHFLEWRSEQAAGLESELERKYWRVCAELEEARAGSQAAVKELEQVETMF